MNYSTDSVTINSAKLGKEARIIIPERETPLMLNVGGVSLVYNMRETKPNLKTKKFFNDGKSFRRDSLFAMAKLTMQVLEDSAAMTGTWCLDYEKHRGTMHTCRCLLWYPLYLMGNPIAMHYFFRAEGLLEPLGKAPTIHLEKSPRNPYSILTLSALEESMRQRIIEVFSDGYTDAKRYFPEYRGGFANLNYRKWENEIKSYIPRDDNIPVPLSRTIWYNHWCRMTGQTDLCLNITTPN
jgi:hypothetical protein